MIMQYLNSFVFYACLYAQKIQGKRISTEALKDGVLQSQCGKTSLPPACGRFLEFLSNAKEIADRRWAQKKRALFKNSVVRQYLRYPAAGQWAKGKKL